jgi:hypothetical protein
MEKTPLERLDTLNIRPLPLIKDALASNENVGGILVLHARTQVFELNMPLILVFVPPCAGTLLLKAHVFPDIVFGSDVFPILKDFRS